MKICFLCQNICSYGGTERVVSLISTELKKLNHECYALSMGKNEKKFFDFSAFSKIDYLYRNGNKLVVIHHRVKKIQRFIQDNKIDVLITVGGHLNYYGWRSGKNSRWIAWDHEMYDFNRSLYVKMSRIIGIKKAEAIVVLTDYDRRRYVETFKKNHQKLHVIGNFTDSYHWKDEKQNKVVITAGRLWNIKQFDLLIKAWAFIYDKIRDWNLIILGEGTERDRLEALIEKYGLDNVSLPGNKQNIYDYYESADIFTITSIAEGFSLVLLEAMAHSLPVVGFKSVGGVSELVDEENGILVEQGNVQSLALSLKKLMIDSSTRRVLGENSYKKSLKYTSEKIVGKWIKLLERRP